MPSYTIYEDVCCSTAVEEVQTLNRTSSLTNKYSSSSSPMLSSRMTSSNKSMMMLHNNYGKMVESSSKQQPQHTKATTMMGYVDLNVHPHLLTSGPNKENIDPLTGRVYPMSSSSNKATPNTNTNSKLNHPSCTSSNLLIRDPLKDITLSVLGQQTQQQPRKKTTSSLQQTPQKNKRYLASASTGSLNPLSPSTLYLR